MLSISNTLIMFLLWYRSPDGDKEIAIPGIASEEACHRLADELALTRGFYRCIGYQGRPY